eukprot:7263880-Prymnesium_polylepis.1
MQRRAGVGSLASLLCHGRGCCWSSLSSRRRSRPQSWCCSGATRVPRARKQLRLLPRRRIRSGTLARRCRSRSQSESRALRQNPPNALLPSYTSCGARSQCRVDDRDRGVQGGVRGRGCRRGHAGGGRGGGDGRGCRGGACRGGERAAGIQGRRGGESLAHAT